jgi:general secretion pathway protein K
MNRRAKRKRTNESGVALVLAMLFIVLLTVLVADFAYEMNVDAALVSAQQADLEAYLAAKSGVASAMALLAGDVLLGEEDARANNAGGIFDSLDEQWANPSDLTSMNDAVAAFVIADEYGKINLNALLFDGGGTDSAYPPLVDALEYLFALRQVDVSPVDAILDWLDEDESARPNGYENAFYESLKTPYQCKNGPMDSLEELLLIPGITPEIYFGDPELDQVPLSDLLTVHGHPEGKININTAEMDVLESILAASQRVSDPLAAAEEIHARVREGEPFFDLASLEAAGLIDEPGSQPVPPGNDPNLPAPPPLPNLFDVNSSTFRIYSDGQAGEASVRIEAYVWRDTPQSGTGQVVGDSQMFRIIGWNVIR